MGNEVNRALAAAVAKLLRPLVRTLLRHGIPFGAFAEVARRVYVEVAAEDLRIPGRKQTVSRIAIITGLTRKDVRRLQETAGVEDTAVVERYHRAARVISGWVRDRRFTDAHGRPLVLPVEGPGATFADLVRRYGGDVPHRAVLDELRRVRAVECPDGACVRLLARAYVPHGGDVDKIGILGTDVADLIATIDHNLEAPSAAAFFQRKVAYDNLPAEVLPKVRALSSTRAQQLLEVLDRWLSRKDRDVNPSVKGTGRRRAGLGIFYFEEDLDEDA